MPDCEDKERSDLEILLDDIFVDTSQKPNMDDVANNLGFHRPKLGFWSDDLFRALVRRLAVRRHSTKECLHKLCELVLGPNETKVGTIITGEGTPATAIATNTEPYTITDSANDVLYGAVSYGLAFNFQITSGVDLTAAEVVNDLNALFEENVIDIRAETISIGGTPSFQLVDSTGILGYNSYLAIFDYPNNCNSVFGFSAQTYRGKRNLGESNKKIKIDEESYSLGDDLPQIARTLVIDEHSSVEESVDYCFYDDSSKNILYLQQEIENEHKKWLNYYGTFLSTDIVIGDTSFVAPQDITDWPTGSTTYFDAVINRGEYNEESVHVTGKSGNEYLIHDSFVREHQRNETIEILYKNESCASLIFPIPETYGTSSDNLVLIIDGTSYNITLTDGPATAATIASDIDTDVSAVAHAYAVSLDEVSDVPTVRVVTLGSLTNLSGRGYNTYIEIGNGSANSIFGLVEGDIYRGDVDVSPVLAVAHQATDIYLHLNDTSRFPKSDFTVIVEKEDREKEETFWISENDIDGSTSGIPNTLVLDTPSELSYGHKIGVSVLPAQLQLKYCSWDIYETRSTGEIQIVVDESCFSKWEPQKSYFHEELHEQTGTSTITDTVAGTTKDEVLVPVADYSIFWGDGSPQGYHDKLRINRVAKLTSSSATEYQTIEGLSRATKLIQAEVVGAGHVIHKGYTAATPAYLFVEDASVFSGVGAYVLISRGNANEEYAQIETIDTYYNIIRVDSISDNHLWYSDSDTYVDTYETIEEVYSSGGYHLYLQLANKLTNSFSSGDSIELFTTPGEMIYEPTEQDITYLPVPASASDLMDGGSSDFQHPQNCRFPGPFIFEPMMNVATRNQTGLGTFLGSGEAVPVIPYPAEILGWADSVIPGPYYMEDVPPYDSLGSRVQYIIVDDVDSFPQGDGHGPQNYLVKLSKDAGAEETIVVTKAHLVPGGTFPVLGVKHGKKPGILEVNTIVGPITKTHKALDQSTGSRGNNAHLVVEEVLVKNTEGFNPSGGWVAFDYGHPSEEIKEYSSVSGKRIIFNDVTFDYGHPWDIGWCEVEFTEFGGMIPGFNTVTPMSMGQATEGSGYDYPLYLFKNVMEILLLGVDGTGPANKLRAAGIKVKVIEQEEE